MNHCKRITLLATFFGLLLGGCGKNNAGLEAPLEREPLASQPKKTAGETEEGESINEYLRNLTYNPEQLLAVTEAGSTEAFPPKTDTSSGVIICTNKKNKAELATDEISILSPSADVIYPGALVFADKNLANGRPTPIHLPRGPMTISTNLPGLSEDTGIVVIEKPTYSKVNQGVKNIVSAFFEGEAYLPAQFTYKSVKIYNKFQASVQLGFSFESLSGSIKASLENNSTTEKTVSASLFRQIYFTVTLDPPSDPADFFRSDVRLASIKRLIGDNNPPAYISSVSYGRMILLTMETNLAESETIVKAAMKYLASAGEAGAETDISIKNVLENSSFNVIVLGGGAKVASQITVGGNKILEKLPKIIKEGAEMSTQSQGYPIAYTARFVKDNALATMSFSTDYIQSECINYANGFVDLKHDGGYVARFFVQAWTPDGKLEVNYSSGRQSIGWSHRVNIPGDATKVRIFAEADTALDWYRSAWDDSRYYATIYDIIERGPTNKCYVIKGTTLHRSYEADPPCLGSH